MIGNLPNQCKFTNFFKVTNRKCTYMLFLSIAQCSLFIPHKFPVSFTPGLYLSIIAQLIAEKLLTADHYKQSRIKSLYNCRELRRSKSDYGQVGINKPLNVLLNTIISMWIFFRYVI